MHPPVVRVEALPNIIANLFSFFFFTKKLVHAPFFKEYKKKIEEIYHNKKKFLIFLTTQDIYYLFLCDFYFIGIYKTCLSLLPHKHLYLYNTNNLSHYTNTIK